MEVFSIFSAAAVEGFGMPLDILREGLVLWLGMVLRLGN